MLKKLYRFLHPRFQSLFLEYPVHLRPRYGHGRPAHPQLLEIIGRHRDNYVQVLQEILQYTHIFHGISPSGQETDERQPAWNNGYLPGLDIIVLYYFMVRSNPGKYVEVGSGNSTKVVRKAIEDQHLRTHIISIDPHPRAEIDALADEIVRMPLEDLDRDIAEELEAGDILFIDNSHRILPNSDAMVFFLEVLPRLKPGVVVQIHDVYLPYDYPMFMCDRFYSEQYGLAIALLSNPGRYQVLLPNYFVSEDGELSQILQPVWRHANLEYVERHGGSFWFKIT